MSGKKLVMTFSVEVETPLDGSETLEEVKERVTDAFFGDEGIFTGEPADWCGEPVFVVVDA